jgi:hypothetical protein
MAAEKTNLRQIRPAPILIALENHPTNSRPSHIANMIIPPVVNVPLMNIGDSTGEVVAL